MESSGFNDHTAVQVEHGGGVRAKRRFHIPTVRAEYRRRMAELQARVGETGIIDFSFTGFCDLFDAMGLEIFTFFSLAYPDLLAAYLEVAVENELNRVHAVADPGLSPLILIPEDFATKHGPIFSPEFLRRYHYPYVRRLAAAWREHGYTVLYHSDGNYLEAIPELAACGIEGFYCLEPGCGMKIVELKRRWPELVWAGGVDGVALMERGTPEQVRQEVRRQILESGVLQSGGMLVATSSEINPLIPAENFLALVQAVDETPNPTFRRC
jgi:uroporphyrinogen decarboxylase